MKLDKALGVSLVEGIASVVGSQVEVVQRVIGTTAIDSDGTSVHDHADIAGDVLLGGLDKSIQGTLQRAEPEAVVDLFGPAASISRL